MAGCSLCQQQFCVLSWRATCQGFADASFAQKPPSAEAAAVPGQRERFLSFPIPGPSRHAHCNPLQLWQGAAHPLCSLRSSSPPAEPPLPSASLLVSASCQGKAEPMWVRDGAAVLRRGKAAAACGQRGRGGQSLGSPSRQDRVLLLSLRQPFTAPKWSVC